jgi:hypothetical protein
MRKTSPSLVIGIDDKLDKPQFLTMHPKDKRLYLRSLLEQACRDFRGLMTPNGEPVQLKLNTVLRVLGHEGIEIVEESGLGLFADYKFGQEVLDTMWADIRALRGYECLKRITFRYDCQVEFLAGLNGKEGACSILPHVKFLPVGPVTDLSEHFYAFRMGLRGGRPEAMQKFGAQVLQFGPLVTENICSPADIQHFDADYWDNHDPVTPAVRPIGLEGNQGNSANAFNVEKAVGSGSVALVIASPIMGAESPREAASLVIQQISAAA